MLEGPLRPLRGHFPRMRGKKGACNLVFLPPFTGEVPGRVEGATEKAGIAERDPGVRRDERLGVVDGR